MDGLESDLVVKSPQREIFQHWRIVAAAFIGTAVTTDHVYAFGVFMAPLHREFGWSRSAISAAFTIISAIGIVVYPAVGVAIDRYGVRKVGIPGLAVHGLLLAAVALCGSNIWNWWIGFGLLGVTQIVCGYAVWSTGIALCFKEQRGLAFGLAFAGSGFCAIFAPSIANALTEHFGWRSAFVAFGVICWLPALPVALLWFKPPLEVKPHTPLRAQFFAPEIWRAPFAQVAGSIVLLAACLAALMIHFVPLVESMGISSTTGAAIAGLIGLGSLLGRIASGSLLDIYKFRHVGAGFCMLPIAATALILLAPPSIIVFSIAALLVGSSLGTESNLAAYAAGHYFSRERYGMVLSIFGVTLAIGSAFGAQLAAVIFDRTGSYNLLCMAIVGLCACAGLLMYTLPSASPAHAGGS